jgi:hypothetical protein
MIADSAFDKPSYSPGETPILTITGYLLYSSATIRIGKVGVGFISESSIGVTGYPAKVVIPMSASDKGHYNVQLKNTANGSYGFTVASFRKTD